MKKFILFSILIISLLTSCSSFFQQKVPMDFDSSGAYLKDLLVEDKIGGKLKTPEQVLVSQNLSTTSIEITWTEVPHANSYIIEFAAISPDENGNFPKEVSEEQFSVLESSWYSNKYVHEITSSTIDDYNDRFDKRFYYKIIATNYRDGFEESAPTSGKNYGTLFAAPRKVVATAGESEDFINISWDSVPGANEYLIYRSESELGIGAIQIATELRNKTTYQDIINSPNDKGKEFYYIVYAVNNKNIKSDQSPIAMGYTLVPGAPPKASGIDISKGRGYSSNQIEIKWNAVPGEVKYNVFRYSSKDSSLTRVLKDSSQTSFIDNLNLEPGIYYYYVIQATTKDDTTGKLLKGAFTDPVEGYILSAPSSISAKKIVGGVQLSWINAIGSDEEQKTYSYKIYVSNELDGEFVEHFQTDKNQANVGDYAYFKISTVKKDGTESEKSETIAPAPNAVSVVNVSRADYSFITDAISANEHSVYPVRISWEKPSNDTPYGYFVYRSTNPDSGFRKINNEVIPHSDKTMEYLDNDPTLIPSKVYYYKVLAVNSLSKGENYSPCFIGWGALTHEAYLKEFNKTIVSSQKKLTLMHKPGSTDKLGTESATGTISGSLAYNAKVVGLGAEITMKYDNYADFYVDPSNKDLGVVFKLTGNSDTSANMSSNGTMHGVIQCQGMYPGTVDYKKIEIKAGAAGGGYYGVTPNGADYKDVFFAVLEEK